MTAKKPVILGARKVPVLEISPTTYINDFQREVKDTLCSVVLEITYLDIDEATCVEYISLDPDAKKKFYAIFPYYMQSKKLVRDKIARKAGNTIHISDAELDKLYRIKLEEELQEFLAADNPQDLIEEAGDLVTLIGAYMNYIHKIPFQTVFDKSIEKSAKRGFFSNVVMRKLNPFNPSNQIYYDRLLKGNN